MVQLLSVEWPRHKLYDRRKRPQFGYRAVHFVPTISGRPVEIQIRTSLQHKWAELFEKVADQWGRGIRYGESLPPAFADKANLVGYLQDIAEVIDAAEREDPRSAASIDANFDIFRRGLLMLEKL